MERAYLQHTPMGDFVTAYLEAEGDVLEKFGKVASSDLDIDHYFVKAVKEIHGADLTQPMPGPSPETVAAWIDPTAKGRGRGLALCAPLAPGATERARAFVADAYHRDEFTASRRRLNVSEELITPTRRRRVTSSASTSKATIPRRAAPASPHPRTPSTCGSRRRLTKIFPPAVDFSKPVEGIEEIFDSTKVADLSLSKAA